MNDRITGTYVPSTGINLPPGVYPEAIIIRMSTGRLDNPGSTSALGVCPEAIIVAMESAP